MKKAIAVFVLATLVISLNIGIGWSEKNKQKNIPTIEKLTFVHYASPPSHVLARWDDTEEDFRLIAGGIKWHQTISYEVNPSGSNLDPEVVRSVLEISSETWDANTTFELYSIPTINYSGVVGYNGLNTIAWGSLDPDIIAVTNLWYYPHNKTIVEFDITFNTYYTWMVNETYPNATYNEENRIMDLQNIATHEFGHNGLDDLRSPKDWKLTMYAYSWYGETDKRTLGYGDVLGIQKLYG